MSVRAFVSTDILFVSEHLLNHIKLIQLEKCRSPVYPMHISSESVLKSMLSQEKTERERVQTLTKWKPKRRQACAETLQHEIQNVDYTLNEYQFIISTQFSTKNP